MCSGAVTNVRCADRFAGWLSGWQTNLVWITTWFRDAHSGASQTLLGGIVPRILAVAHRSTSSCKSTADIIYADRDRDSWLHNLIQEIAEPSTDLSDARASGSIMQQAATATATTSTSHTLQPGGVQLRQHRRQSSINTVSWTDQGDSTSARPLSYNLDPSDVRDVIFGKHPKFLIIGKPTKIMYILPTHPGGWRAKSNANGHTASSAKPSTTIERRHFVESLRRPWLHRTAWQLCVVFYARRSGLRRAAHPGWSIDDIWPSVQLGSSWRVFLSRIAQPSFGYGSFVALASYVYVSFPYHIYLCINDHWYTLCYRYMCDVHINSAFHVQNISGSLMVCQMPNVWYKYKYKMAPCGGYFLYLFI